MPYKYTHIFRFNSFQDLMEIIRFHVSLIIAYCFKGDAIQEEAIGKTKMHLATLCVTILVGPTCVLANVLQFA